MIDLKELCRDTEDKKNTKTKNKRKQNVVIQKDMII